jgi:hypothetical protein
MVETETPTAHARRSRRQTLTRRLVAMAALISAIFGVPIAVQKGLDQLGLWKPLVARVMDHKRPGEHNEPHEFSVFFRYESSTLSDEGLSLPGMIGLDARNSDRRFSIGCTVDGAESADQKIDAIGLSVDRATYVRSKLVEVGVPASQILPGLDPVAQAVAEPGVREPLNRRCVVRSTVASANR